MRDIDLADLQSKAFKFMILQKPKVSKPATHTGGSKPYQASFLPDNKIPEELQRAFDQNNEFRQLMQIPDRVLLNRTPGPSALSRYNRTAHGGAA